MKRLYDPELCYMIFEELDLLNESTINEIEGMSDDIPMSEFIKLIDGIEELKEHYPEFNWNDMLVNDEEPESFGFFASIYRDMFCCYLTFDGQITHMWVAECDQCDDGLIEETCNWCNGSGEGCADGTTCDSCGGSGVQIVSCSCPLGLKHN